METGRGASIGKETASLSGRADYAESVTGTAGNAGITGTAGTAVANAAANAATNHSDLEPAAGMPEEAAASHVPGTVPRRSRQHMDGLAGTIMFPVRIHLMH